VLYIPPFSIIRGRLSLVKLNGRTKMTNSYEDFLEIVKLFLRTIPFDERWYLSEYPDVAEAVTSGVYKSGRHHFIEVGYFEGRRPGEFEVDDQWYLKEYPDVAAGIKRGDITSPLQHFNQHGYEEGRMPRDLPG
jgi:hypothetical protein